MGPGGDFENTRVKDAEGTKDHWTRLRFDFLCHLSFVLRFDFLRFDFTFRLFSAPPKCPLIWCLLSVVPVLHTGDSLDHWAPESPDTLRGPL